MLKSFFAAICLIQVVIACGEVLPIPYKPDPPITVDGVLDDWAAVPVFAEITGQKNVVWKKGESSQWQSDKDLSGVIHMAWRPEGLYVAAKVKDDTFRNSFQGCDMFHGDHLELFIDTCPDSQPANKKFGAGQFQIALSPGNLDDTRPLDAFGRINPEAYQYQPEGKALPDIKVASKKTAEGWNIEAFIGWNTLGITLPEKGKRFGIEVALSDSDSPQGQQEKMMMVSTVAWKGPFRDRLVSAALADSNGKVPALTAKSQQIAPVMICGRTTIPVTSSVEKKFTLPQLPANFRAILFVRSRLESKFNGGDAFSLTLALNGRGVDGRCLVNKTAEMESREGDMIKIYSGSDGFRVPYAPSFEDANLPYSAGNRYARFVSREPRTDFKFDVTDLLKKGENILKIGNSNAHVKTSLNVADVVLSFVPGAQQQQPKQLQCAERYYCPTTEKPEKIDVRVGGDNSIKISTRNVSRVVKSEFSIPGGKWATGSNDFFSLERTVTQKDGVVIVTDNFKNLTDRNLGIIQRHEFEIAGTKAKYYLNGVLRPAGLSGYYDVGASNGTSYVELPSGGIGMLALNDAFVVHAQNYLLAKGGIGLCDSNLVIAPGASYAAQWAILSMPQGDYWDFINTLRRFLDVNFLINGSGAVVQSHKSGRAMDWSVEKFREFFTRKGAFFGISAMSFRTTYNGKKIDYVFDQGTAVFTGDNATTMAYYAKWRKAVPDLKILGYFHCFIDTSDYSEMKFPKDRLLAADGTQVEYGLPYYKIYFPTLTNRFGKAISPIIDLYFKKMKIDGIFWDEITQCKVKYHYGKPWDNCSGDIDMNTHNVVALKSSISLITKDWRLQQAKKILKLGYLVGNGVPCCREMRELKIPCFTETAQSSFAARQQLYSPLVLGDHLSEESEVDAYRNMLSALDYGCVYYWYGDRVIPGYETLTSKMFPITPVQLGQGFIIGKERIVTRTSGFFGWGDSSEHEVFFYDETGMQVVGRKVKTKMVDGKTFSEIDLWPDWSAVIVRKSMTSDHPDGAK